MNHYFYIIIILLIATLFFYIFCKEINKIKIRGLKNRKSISDDEIQNYDKRLERVLDNTILTFSVDEANDKTESNCNRYYNSLLNGSELLKKENFKFPDMRGL